MAEAHEWKWGFPIAVLFGKKTAKQNTPPTINNVWSMPSAVQGTHSAFLQLPNHDICSVHQLLVHGFLHWKRDIAILCTWPQFGFHVRVEGCICQHLPGLTTARTLSFLRVEKGRHWTPTLHTFSMGWFSQLPAVYCKSRYLHERCSNSHQENYQLPVWLRVPCEFSKQWHGLLNMSIKSAVPKAL